MKELRDKIQKRFNEMIATGNLFRSTVTGDELWEQYISGFNNDPVFRDPESSVHNCNLCKHFIRRYGNIIAFDKDYNIMTIWDVDCDEEYKNSFKQMSDWIKLGSIRDIFIETLESLNKTNYGPSKRNQDTYQLGNAYNIKRYTAEEAALYPNSGIKEGDVFRFEHFALTLPKDYVDYSGKSIEMIMAEYRQRAQVFKRGLDEISLDTMYLVRDLESQGSLLNGISYKHFILGAIKAKEEYDKITDPKKKEIYTWIESGKLGTIASFRNTAIGTLLVELSEGKEINEAVKAFNKMVDPINYMKATAPITKNQITNAEKFVEENGYTDSFNRRCATINDINVSEILHSNISTDIKTKVSVFDKVKATATRHKRNEFDKVEEVSIEKFMSDILPNCTSVEVYLISKHKKNFVNLITSIDKDSKHMFKWNNNFSWTYNGNLAGKSEIREAVKAKGGCVDAPLRCSIIWNEEGDAMHTDMDNHCFEQHDHIYFAEHRSDRGQAASVYGGYLDIDITDPHSQCNGGPGVENIYYPTYKDGVYEFRIHSYNGGFNNGARAEIYFKGVTYNYKINRPIKNKEFITLATLTIKNGVCVIKHGSYFIGDEDVIENIYNLDTNQFHKVNLVCLSPNYWQEHGIGNKHYFFMLEGAQNPEEIRSIHNEFLNDELRNHRKVIEVLGNTLKIESTKDQLCGLGFNSTVRDEVILRLGGSHKRVIKVKF